MADMNRAIKALPHLNIVLASMLIVLTVVDYFNGSMGFLDNDIAKGVMLLLSVTAIVNAIVLIALQRRTDVAGG
jgi:hypothetical protein